MKLHLPKLMPREREVLAAVYHQAMLPVTEIAKQIGLRVHQVHYTLNRLSEQGIIQLQPFIDVYRLGLIQYEVYLSLGSGKRGTHSSFLASCRTSSDIAWAGRFIGNFQYGLTLCAVNARHAHSILENFVTPYREAILGKYVAERLSFHEFRLKTASVRAFGPSALTFGDKPGNVDCDEADRKILVSLCRHPGLSLQERGSRLKLAVTTLHHRIKHLEKEQIIRGYTYVIDFTKLGLHRFKILLSARGVDSHTRKNFYTFVSAHPAVNCLIESIGAWDFQLAVHLNDPEEIFYFLEELHEHFGNQLNVNHVLTEFGHIKVLRYPLAHSR